MTEKSVLCDMRCWTILVDHYLDFASLCNLLTVSKRIGRLVDLTCHRWHENPQLDNNVVARLERAYTESMLHLRRFAIERRTLTKRELWPYFGVELAPGNQWTIVAPSVPLCASTNCYELPDSESFGESVDGFDRWPSEFVNSDRDGSGSSRQFARVKTSHWNTKSPFLRLLAMQKLRHSACTHTARFAQFSARFARGAQKNTDAETQKKKSRILSRTAEKVSGKKRKIEEAMGGASNVKKAKLFAPRLVNFDPSRDAPRLLNTRH